MGGSAGGTMGSQTQNSFFSPGGLQSALKGMFGAPAGTPAPAPAPAPAAPAPAPAPVAQPTPALPTPTGPAGPSWLQQFMGKTGGVAPASAMPAQRQIQQPSPTQPGQSVTGGTGAPSAGNFFGTAQIPKGFAETAQPQQRSGFRFGQGGGNGGLTPFGQWAMGNKGADVGQMRSQARKLKQRHAR